MDKSLADLRQEYANQELNEESADPNPLQQFYTWFGQAVQSGLREPNGMALATVGPNGRPAARTVLLKGYDERGFVFYTNYESRKGQELAANPFGALLFWWPELERQVRIEGRVEQVTAAESDAYFATRPLAARLGAWASPQSAVLPTRGALVERLQDLAARFQDQAVPRPPHWGGYRVVPDVLEFWQGRQSRLHDRLQYRRVTGGGWEMQRLAP